MGFFTACARDKNTSRRKSARDRRDQFVWDKAAPLQIVKDPMDATYMSRGWSWAPSSDLAANFRKIRDQTFFADTWLNNESDTQAAMPLAMKSVYVVGGR